MGNSQGPSDGYTADAAWAEYGASTPEHGGVPPSGDIPRLTGRGGAAARRAGGLLAGAFFGVVALGAPAWVLGHSSPVNPGLACGVGLAGGALGVGAYQLLKSLRGRGTFGRRSSPVTRARAEVQGASSWFFPELALPAAAPAMSIHYQPPPEAADPRATELEERLLFLCRQDGQLLRRLLDYERSRQPHARRLDLLRLAIEHLERDNR